MPISESVQLIAGEYDLVLGMGELFCEGEVLSAAPAQRALPLEGTGDAVTLEDVNDAWERYTGSF